MRAQTIAKRGRRVARSSKPAALRNSDIGELLAIEAETAKPPLMKAFRRAARRSFLWPEEAAALLRDKRSLTELAGIGPYIQKIVRRWIAKPPAIPQPPPIRTGFLTLSYAREILAADTRLPLPRGDLQMHSDWSDGSGTIAEMAEAAMQRGYEYIAITDHSKGLKIAGGIDEAKLRQQAVEIDATNDAIRGKGQNFRILRSIELNLSPRGEGDMDEGALAELDIVLGCFHSSLRRTEDQTERYLAALRNPAIQILGHPRGRIYNYRLGLKADWPRVFDLAAELDKAVEIDSYPDRQDLNIDLVMLAKKSGCRISLGTDSHGPSQLAFIEFGLAAATLAAIKQDRILNFMTFDGLRAWVTGVRQATQARDNSHSVSR